MEYTSSTAIIMLLLLVATIVVGFVRKVNTGFVGFLVALISGLYLVGMSKGDIVKGWPTDLAITLMGIMLLFSIAKNNKTMEKIATMVVNLSGGKAKLLPILFFLLSAILSAMVGPVPMCAVLMPLCMPTGKKAGVPDMLTGLSVISGVLAGGLGPITTSGAVAFRLAQEVGINNYTPTYLAAILNGVLMFVVYYLVFGGWRLPDLKHDTAEQKEKISFDRNQIITLVGIACFIISVIFLSYHTGLSAFAISAVLLLLGVADEKASIAGINWGTILMIGGMAVLINVVSAGGGIQLLADGLSSIMSEKTASAIMVCLGGVMSSVSSASGVVMPTLIPTIPGILSNMGLTVDTAQGLKIGTDLLAGIVIGAHAVTMSPLSSLGAMALASVNEETDKQKFFSQMFLIAVLSVIGSAILAFLGLYRIFG